MYTIYFQFNVKPSANGSYAVSYSVQDVVTKRCVIKEECDYTPRVTVAHNNDLRTKVRNAITMRLKEKYDISRNLNFKCLNPKSDFLTMGEMMRNTYAAKRKAENEQKKLNGLDSTAWEETKATPTFPVKASSGGREFVLVPIIDGDGNEHWVIKKSNLKVFTEQEAKEELFKIQMEALNGGNN